MKILGNTDVAKARENVKDIEVFGAEDTFQVISKASSKSEGWMSEGWMKSTKAMEVSGAGCVVTCTTQLNPDGSYSLAEALTFVPGAWMQNVYGDGPDEDGAFEMSGRIVVDLSGLVAWLERRNFL